MARLFYVKPCKKLFSDWNLSHMRKISWEHINFYVETTLFYKQEDWQEEGKTGGLEKCGQDLKMYYLDNWSLALLMFSLHRAFE